MTSKKLYWAKWKENIRRRGWTFLFGFVVLLFLIPISGLIELNSLHNAMSHAMLSAADAERVAMCEEEMRQALAGRIGFSEMMVIYGLAFAVLFAVQGFSFLFDQRKMDLYMSVPVSGQKRFLLIWANGIVMFAGSYLICLLAGWGIGAAWHVMSLEMLAESMLAFLVNTLAFIAMYQVALLAVMLTGNVLTALLGSFVLFIYEPVLRMLYGALKSSFFVSYCSADQRRLEAAPLFTPLSGYLNFVDGIRYENGMFVRYLADEYGNASGGWCSALAKESGLLLLSCLVTGLLVYYLFRRRKTESYHNAIAFPAWKPVLEAFLLTPFSLMAALLVSNMADDKEFFLFAGGVAGILVGHALIQLVYERDLRAIVKKRGAAAVAFLLTMLALCIFRFDLAGFDNYVPRADKIESVSVTLESDYSSFGYANLETGSMRTGLPDRLLTRMNSKEPETIAAVLSMAERWQAAGRPTDEEKWAQQTDSAGQESWEDSRIFVACYHLTNGRRVYRRFYVNPGQSADALDTVTNDAAYQNLRYQIYEEAFAQAVDRMKIVYDDGVQEFLYTLDKKEILEALREDFEGYSYRMIARQLPCGILKFSLPDSNGRNMCVWNYPVYEAFSNTVDLLGENEIAVVRQGGILDAEDIKEITVSYYVYDSDYEMESELFEKGEVPEQEIVCTFEEPEEIREIIKGLYAYRFVDVAGLEFLPWIGESGYQPQVSLTQEAIRSHHSAGNVFFLKGKVPAFVKKKIREAAIYG